MDYSDKKVVFVTGSLSNGGSERVISILANGCAKLGTKVTLIVLREEKQTYPISNQVNLIQLHDSKIRAFKEITRLKALHEALKKSNANAVIPFLPIVTLYTMIANVGVGMKLIASERADPNVGVFDPMLKFKDKVANILMRRIGLFNLADWMVFQTPDAQAWYSQKRQKRSSLIANPLDTEHLPDRNSLRIQKRIVAAGRFAKEKNFPLLIRGFAQFHKDFPEYTLTIYGEGSCRQEYEALIKQLGIEDYVSMPGFEKNLNEKIVDASMFVSTSNHEGLSNSMLEALGMGIPTIVTDCPVGGARMVIHNNVNGILIPMEATAELAQAMRRIAEDQTFASSLSNEAMKIREELSAEKICKKWLELV